MPSRDHAPLGAPCWIDLMTSDTTRSRSFYADLFGWTPEAQSDEFGGYFMFTRNGVPVAGGMPAQANSGPDVWSIYLASDDAQKTVERAAAGDAQIYAPPIAIADLGTMAVIADPSGATIGIWQPGTFAGLTALGEAGTASWFELQTRDYDRATGFYRDVFGWDTQTMSDTPDFRYTIDVNGEDQLAGIMDASSTLSDGVASHWSVYFGVDDTDAAVAKAISLGGAVVTAAADSPYGRLAELSDPTGAQFRIIAANR